MMTEKACMMVQFWGYDAIFIFDKFYVVFASQKDL